MTTIILALLGFVALALAALILFARWAMAMHALPMRHKPRNRPLPRRVYRD